MRGRSRLLALLLLPSAVCLWAVGWLLFCVGAAREPVEAAKSVRRTGSSGLSFVVGVSEKEIAA